MTPSPPHHAAFLFHHAVRTLGLLGKLPGCQDGRNIKHSGVRLITSHCSVEVKGVKQFGAKEESFEQQNPVNLIVLFSFKSANGHINEAMNLAESPSTLNSHALTQIMGVCMQSLAVWNNCLILVGMYAEL